MSRLKLSFSFLLTLMLVAMFSIVASAAPSNGNTPNSYNPDVPAGSGTNVVNGVQTTSDGLDNSYDSVTKSNANKTGSGVWVNDGSTKEQVLKSTGLKKADGTHNQRTHGEYMNNTNSCASCHQTHTGASEGLLFKDGKYATCTACHDGTLGFYNVMTGSNSAGTFGGTHDGNMSAHLADGTVKLNAAPGGNFAAKDEASSTRGGEWTEEFTCANCHAPHGSYSDRLLNEDPNGMANTELKDGGKKLVNVPVVDKSTVTDFANKVAAGNITWKDAANQDQTANYIVYRFTIGDNTLTAANTPVNADYTAKGLQTGDVVLQLMKWVPKLDKDGNEIVGSTYVVDTDPWLHEYDFDEGHTKHYWTAFYDGEILQNTDKNAKSTLYSAASTYTTDTNFVGKNVDIVSTDNLKAGEKLGQGFLGVRNDKTTYPGADTLTTAVNGLTSGNIARGYVVRLVKVMPAANSSDDINNVYSTNVAGLWAKSSGGKGVAMSNFCAACHTDYLAASGKETGTFDHAYRHSTNSDSYTCVRCHYAHGTDVTIMRDSRGLTYTDILKGQNGGANYFTSKPYVDGGDNTAREALVKDYLLDKNPSSVLKRYTNMAVCWGCHTSSHSGGTRNTDSYKYDTTPGVDTDRNGIDDAQSPNTPNAGF